MRTATKSEAKAAFSMPIYPTAEHKNFLSFIIDENGAALDFPLMDEEYKQLREMIVDSLGTQNPEDFAELVCQKVKPKKLVQFFPVGSILDAQQAPQFHAKNPWYQLFLQHALRDPNYAQRN